MTPAILLLLVIGIAAVGYAEALRRTRKFAGKQEEQRAHSLPVHHGALVMASGLIPALLVWVLWAGVSGSVIRSLLVAELPIAITGLPPQRFSLALDEIRNLAAGVSIGSPGPEYEAAAKHLQALSAASHGWMTVAVLGACGVGVLIALRRLNPQLRARTEIEMVFQIFLGLCSTVAVFTTLGVLLSVLWESIRFFEQVPITEFLFGLEWSPQTAIRADQVGASGSFGAVPLFAGTLLISSIAVAVGAPIGLFSAIYLSEYSSPHLRSIAKPIMEILAGIPTVVYGFFAALMVAPFLRGIGEQVGLDVSSESALAAGVVMGIMLVPFVSSLADDVIRAVPQSLRDGSYGLGASRSETIRKVVLPAALPGIVGALLLSVSRAIGETMIVVMAAGLAANLTGNPFEAVTTVTVQIVTLLVGDQEFDSPKTLAAFALGLTLFTLTLVLNVYALYIVRKYREQYD